MENKIIRLVIVRNDTNNILGFVALRSNGTETYGFNETAESRKSHMNKLMNELMRTYPNGLSELIRNNDTKGIKEALIKNGYLLETKKDIITKLTIHEDNEEYFEVEYANKESEIIRADDYANINDYDKILEVCKQEIEKTYRITNIQNFKGLVEDIMPEKVDGEKVYGADDEYEFEDEDDELIERGVNKVKDNLKVNNFKWTKRLLAVVTAGAIALGAYSCGKKKEKEEIENTPSIEISDSEEFPTFVPTSVPTQIPTQVPTMVPTPVPTPVPTSVPTPIPTPVVTSVPSNYMTPYEKSLEPEPYTFLSYNPEDSMELFTIIDSEGSEEVYDYNNTNINQVNIESLYEITTRNLSELLYFANKGESPLAHYDELSVAPRRVHYERLIWGLNPIDAGYVKKFSDYNNDIIYLGYMLEDPIQAKEVNNLVVREMIRCIDYNQPLRYTVNGQEVCTRFTDLSYEAQEAIRKMCWGNYCLLGSDIVEFDGDYYNQALLGIDIYGLSQEPTSKR